jgi:O-antigen ligase
MAIRKEVLVMKSTTAQIPLTYAPERLTILLGLFYLWLFMVLDRPQDFFPQLQAVRPALILGCLLVLFFLPQNPAAALKSVLTGRQSRLYVCLLAVMVLGIPFSRYPSRSFHAVFIEQSSNMLLFFFLYALIDSVAKLKRVLFLAVVSAGLYSAFCLARGTFVDERLFFGDMFDPNDLSFFVLSFLPFGCLFLTGESRLRRLLSAGALVSGILLIIYSGSRGGFIAFAVVCGLMAFSKNRSITRSARRILLLAGIPCILFMLLGTGTSRYSTILNPEGDYNYFDETGRLAIWERGIDLMASNPVTGVGVGCFDEAIGEERKAAGLLPKWQAAHNAFIQIGAETGILGLVLFTAMILNALIGFARVKKAAAVDLIRIAEMGFIGLIGQVASITFLSQAYSPYWVFYMVLPFVLLRLSAHEKPEVQPCS